MTYDALVQLLAQQYRELTEWEQGFITSLEGRRLALECRGDAFFSSPKEEAVLRRMGEQYISPLVIAELQGQQRLFT